MAISFGNMPTRTLSWQSFKSLAVAKNLSIQYETNSDSYTIYAYDVPEVMMCIIWTGTVPGGTDQTQNDLDKSDFETSYRSTANKRITRTDNFGNSVAIPFETAISLGQVPSASFGLAAGYIGTSATTSVTVRATAYTPQGVNLQRSIRSTSASDNVTGSGAQRILMTYLNEALDSYKTEIIGLSGTNYVNTVNTDIAFIERLEVERCGAGGGNVGTIQLQTQVSGGGSLWASIAVGDNQTYWAQHYVVSGATCNLINISGFATAVGGQLTINVTGNPSGTVASPQKSIGSTYGHGAEVQFSGQQAALTAVEHPFRFPLRVTGPNFIFINERPISGSSSTAYASFEYFQF